MMDFIASELKKSQLALAAAKAVMAIDPNSAANRAYYAAFHAVTAYFAALGQSFAKHSALRGALHRELVRTGTVSGDVGQDFDFLMDLRESGDYGGLIHVGTDDARMAIEAAERVCAAILPFLGRTGD